MKTSPDKRGSPSGQVSLWSLPSFLSVELSSYCGSACDMAAKRKFSPFPSPIPGNFRWRGVSVSVAAASKTKLFPSDRPQSWGSHIYLKNPQTYKWNIFKLLKGTALEICIATKGLYYSKIQYKERLHLSLVLKRNNSKRFIVYLLVCLDESPSYYIIQGNIVAGSVV